MRVGLIGLIGVLFEALKGIEREKERKREGEMERWREGEMEDGWSALYFARVDVFRVRYLDRTATLITGSFLSVPSHSHVIKSY